MKLHLPHRLRNSIVACFATVFLTLASGLIMQTGAAAEIEYNPVSGIPEATWTASSLGEYAFSPGDSVSFYKPAIITLEATIQAGVVNVREQSELTLVGNGNTLSANLGIDLGMDTVLTVKDNALAAGTALTQSSGGLLRFDWGSTTTSFDAHLTQYRGAIAVRNSTLITTPGTANAWDRLTMEGTSTLQLGSGAELRAPSSFLGDHTVLVSSGNATLEGEISGYGSITKTGSGTLLLGPNDIVHTGDLIINAGTVQWGETANKDNTLCFRSIVVNSGATFNDGHQNRISLRDVTDVVLNNGGKMTGAPAPWHVYNSLTVNGSGSLEGNRRFALLTGQGSLTVGTGTTRLETIRDFSGTIAGGATKLMIDLVDVAEGKTVTVSRAVTPDTLTKVGAGTLSISGAVTAENDLVVEEGPMNINGALTATNAIFTGDCTYRNAGNVTTRGFFSVTGDETDVTVTGTLSAGTQNTTSSRLAGGTIGVQPTLEMAGKALHITGAATANGTISFSSGTSTLDSNLTASQYGGRYASRVLVSGEATQVSIGGSLQAGSLDMAGQGLDITGAVTVTHDAVLHAGATTAASAAIGGNARLDNTSLVLQNNLTAASVSVNASTLTTSSITTNSISIGGGSSVKTTGAVTTDSFDLDDGIFTSGGSLSVHKMLTMNYTGTLAYQDISLGKTGAHNKDIVLSYASGRDAVLNLSAEELAGHNVIYVDVSRVSEKDLQAGIDLGISKSAKERLNIAQLANYTLDDSGATLILKAASKQPVLAWDANWGIVEIASAPQTIKEDDWSIIAEKEGLYQATYYDNGSYLIAANATTGEVTVPGNITRSHLLYGGAYGTQPVDAEGGNIYRDIWLNIAGGQFTMVAGGSCCEPAPTTSGSKYPWNIVGDTHIQVSKDILSIGSIIGSNFLDGSNPTHTGDSYISIYSSHVLGSVIGSGYHVSWGTTYYGVTVPTNATITHTGNTNIFVYANLPTAVNTDVIDRSLTETSEGLITTIDQNAVVGGTVSSYNAQTSTINGNTNVTFDFSDLTASAPLTVKSAVSSHWGLAHQRQTGDSSLSFMHMNGASFAGTVYASGHYNNSGTVDQTHTGDGDFLIYDAERTGFAGLVSGAHTANGAGNGTQARTGDSHLLVSGSSGVAFGNVVAGDHLWVGATTNTSQTHQGVTSLVVQDSDNTSFRGTLTASSYFHGGDHANSGNVTQTNTGGTTLLIDNSARTSLGGDVTSGGSYAFLSDEMPATLSQTNSGEIEVIILDSSNISCGSVLVGGHYAYDAVDEPAPPQTTPRTTVSQTHTGLTLLSVVNSPNSRFARNVVGGHYATGDQTRELLTDLTLTQTQTGDTTINIINDDSTTFAGGWFVGGHYTDMRVQNSITQTHTTSNININVNCGSFVGIVVGGDVNNYIVPRADEVTAPGPAVPLPWSSTISGNIHFTLSNASFGNEVVGGSYLVAQEATNRVHRTNSINDITIDAENCSFSRIVGGYDIDCQGNSTVADITINLKDCKVSSDIYGGSWLKSFGDTALGVNQGEITLNLKGGSYRGNIYAAGRQDGTGTIISTSTRVDIADDVTFGEIIISGGYRGGPGRAGSIVTGDRTLAFSTPGSTYKNVEGVSFIYFDTVEVAEGSTVTLNENLQLLDNSVTKTGLGTLDIFHTNDLDTVIVREGRLRLAANCVKTNMIEHLHVADGGILDITKGNSGINGIVTMAEGSTLACTVNQYAPTVTNVDWAGKVNLEVAGVTPAISEGGYTIALFKGDTTRGLDLANVTGLTLGVVSGIEGLATRADAYVNSVTDGFSTDGAYLVLRGDTLYLTNEEAPACYWLGGSDTWNDTRAVWSRSETGKDDKKLYETGARTFFIAQDATPVTVTLGKDESAFSVTVRDGEFNIAKGAGERITLERGDLVVQNGTAHIHPEVVFSEYSGITVDDDSVLTMDGNDAVTVYNLSNGGTIDVGATTPLTVKNIMQNSGSITAGNTVLGHGTAQGGTLHVANLKLGGDTAFTQLESAAVTGNQGHTLSINGSGASSIKSIDGGRLAVQNGSLAISTPAATTLESLHGNGSLTTTGALSSGSASSIGNLTTPELRVGTSLTVNGTLVTDSITLASAYLDAPSVHSGSIKSATEDHTVDVLADSSVFTGLYPMSGKSYYIVKSDTPTASPLTINGHEDKETVYANRYAYTLTVKDDGIEMKGALANTGYYEDNATTENGRAGASMLDKLFTDGQFEKLQIDSPNGTVMQILHRMDELAQQKAHGELDRLAASAGGASIAPMSLAFNEDISRQLRAMRNRSTVMGLPPCEVHNDLPYVNAWINAEGDFTNVNEDATQCGYDLKSWGGTVGMDVDCTSAFTAALAVSALHGDYRVSGTADTLDGDMDTVYVSMMGRYARKAWSHTFAASIGFASFNVDRTVNKAGIAYGAKGETDGVGFGFMYEVGYACSLGAYTSIQPVLNLSYVHGGLGGYTESGSEAALHVNDMNCNTFTVAAGVRIQRATEPDAYSRSILLEGRALAKVVTGDTQSEAETALMVAPKSKATMKSAEIGNVGMEIGGGISIPVGQESSFIFADVSAEIRRDYTNVNGTVGYRINF